MPVYEYTALDSRGKSVSGIIDAESSSAARQKLRTSGNYPVSVKETHKTPEKKSGRSFSFLPSLSRVRPAEVAMTTKQLATLAGAGFPLVSAIDVIVGQTKTQGFKKIMAQVKDAIVEGSSFAAALTPFPAVFSPIYVNMVAAGESSGTLEIVLDRLADITEKQQALKTRIATAMTYPIIMTLMGVGVLFILMTYIVPRIAAIFDEIDRALPAMTRFLISASNVMQSYWWLFLLFFITAALIFRNVKKTPRGKYLLDKAVLATPLFGSLASRLAVARFARTLGSLLENGVSMLAAMDIVKNIVGNSLIADAVADAAQEVGKGQGLGKALDETEMFPNLAIQMILVGEQSGELEHMLGKIADVYETEAESTIMRLTALLEPLMILSMAVVVGFIVVSIILPIVEMNQGIK